MHSHYKMLNSERYAPAIGDSCLDLQGFVSREAYEDSGRDPNKMDEDGLYIPETDYYHVVSIIQGTCVVLRGGGMNGQKLYVAISKCEYNILVIAQVQGAAKGNFHSANH